MLLFCRLSAGKAVRAEPELALFVANPNMVEGFDREKKRGRVLDVQTVPVPADPVVLRQSDQLPVVER